MRAATWLAVGVFWAGCGADDSGLEIAPDAGGSDGAVADVGAASPDSGAAADDALMPDVGVPDVGVPDAGVPDAGAPDADGVTAATVPLRGVCDLAARYGAVTVQVSELDEYSYAEGQVADGVVPASVLEEVGQVGDCRLMRQNNPFCAALCQPGTTCAFSGECVPYPAPQDLGTLTVTGLLDAVEMTPLQPGNKYFQTGLTHPAFEPGALIGLQSTAGVYGALSLYGVGGEALVPTSAQVDVQRDGDVNLAWAAPAEGARTRVFLTMTVDQHGSTPVALTCDFSDTGAGVVPAALINQWLDFGITGFPNGRLSRRTVDSVMLDPEKVDSTAATEQGCMEFVVERLFELDVRVAGHIPCKKPSDCPSGQTCDVMMETCE